LTPYQTEIETPETDSGVDKKYLLTAKQMATFVTNGYLMVENLVPEELNEAVYRDLRELSVTGFKSWLETDSIRAVLDLPQFKGIKQGLVGSNPALDRSTLHVVNAGFEKAQNWHADSLLDLRPLAFDVQAFYFAHDTSREMGATLVLPGSHLRKISTDSITRYKNIVGQRQLECKAGTMVFMHHGIWHCAQPNHTDQTRYLFKLRITPRQEQRGLFNLDGYQDPEVVEILDKGHQAWQGNEARPEHNRRARLWRYLTGDDEVDVSFERTFTRMGVVGV